MSTKIRRPIAVGLLLILSLAPAAAQEQRGAIEGVVKDTSGGILTGIPIVARSLTGLVSEVRTDSIGAYRFPDLPPGTYELSGHLAGFVPAIVTGIDVRIGRQLTIDLILTPAGPGETVSVTVPSPLIAITQSAGATSLRGDEIEKMPKGRDFMSLVTQVPGANAESKLAGISLDGTGTSESRVLIDGAESTDLIFGGPGQHLVTDFVDELQIKSSGYSAGTVVPRDRC